MSRPIHERLRWLVLLSLIAAVGLAACPLPQPLTEVAREDGGAVTPPPRILTSSVRPPGTVTLVERTCTNPRFQLQAQIEDFDTTEQVEARWFIDYDPSSPTVWAQDIIPGSEESSATVRPLLPFSYEPSADALANLHTDVHVVEVVVSNGFASIPSRVPIAGYDTQIFRWVFQFVDEGTAGAICQYPPVAPP